MTEARVPVTCAFCYLTFPGTPAQSRSDWAACPDCAAMNARARMAKGAPRTLAKE